MADLTSFITIAPSNSTIFSNSCNNDMLVYTESKTQKILIGTMSNAPAALGVTSNTISIGAPLVPVSDVTYDLGTSNSRFRDLYLSGNTIDLGGTRLKKDSLTGALSVTDSNGNYNSVIVSQIQVGNTSNVVTIQLDSNNQVQFVATTLSNGQAASSNVASVGGWSNVGSNLVIIGSNVGVGKSNPQRSIDTAGDINFDGILYKNGVPYIGSQWSNDSINVFLLESNVGIGTMNPLEKLEVAGNAKIESNAYIMSNAGIRTAFPNEALEVYNGNALIGCNMYVMSNLGIGTSNPSAALEVVGNTILRSNLTVEGTLTAVKMNVVTSNILVYSNEIVNDTLVVLNRVALSNTSGYSYFDSLGTNIGLNTGSPTESFTIVGCNIGISNASGKTVLTGSNSFLGINKAAPAFTLDVGGDLNFDGILRKSGVPYIGSQWSNNGSNIFVLGSNIGIYTQTPSEAIDIVGSNMKVGCNLYVLGSIGVGKSNPAYSIDTAGDINFDGILRKSGVPYIGSQWSNSGSNVFIFGSNIGIGVSNPTSALTIVGDLDIRSNILLTNQQLVFRGVKLMKNSNMSGAVTNVTTVVTAVPDYIYSNSNHLFTTTYSNYLSIANGPTETLRVTSNMVGIGASSPSSILHLASNAAAGVNITFCNTSTGSSPATFGLSSAGDVSLSLASNNNILFGTSNSERVRITSNGFVGIGTNAPASALHLASNAAANVLVTMCNSATGSRPASFGLATTGDLSVTVASNNNILFGTSNAERMRITSNGLVGINTASPTTTLAVAGMVSASNFYANQTGVGAPTIGILGGNGDRMIFWPGTASAYPFSIGINNSTMWRSVPTGSIHQWYINGNVGMTLSNNLLGIGFANPSYILDVNGNSRINGNMYLGTTGAYVSSTAGTYGTVSVSGYAKNSWYGYDINTWFCYMANNNTSVGIHDNANSWVFYYDKSDNNNRYCNLYWGGGGSGNNLRLQTTSYGVSVPNTLYIGTANFNTNTWHTSSDGKNRLYCAANSHTYFGSADAWYFQHATNGNIASIANNGYAYFNAGLGVSGGVNFNGGGYTFQLGSSSIFDTGAGSRVTTNQNGTIYCYLLDQGSWLGNGWLQTKAGNSSDYKIVIDCTQSYCGINAYNGGSSARDLYINNNGGTVRLGGTVVKGGGSFDIVHPDPAKAAQNYRLRHCFVETPTRGDNLYTFKVTTQTENEKFAIDLPDYFYHLNENPRVLVSCEEEELLSRCCAKVTPDMTMIRGMAEFPGTYMVMVIGTRKDQLMIDYFDKTGGVEYIMLDTDPMHPNFTPPSGPVLPGGSNTQ